MFEKLRQARLRRQHGPHRAELILHIEGELERMPPGSVTDAWCEWMWRLPAEAWGEAVALRRLAAEQPALREAGVRAITRLSRARQNLPDSPATADLAQEVERMKEESVQRDLDHRARLVRFTDRYGPPPR